MKQALARHNLSAIQRMLVDAANVDRAIKGVRKSNAWLELQALVARLAGVKLRRVA
jgi:DNA polymerase III delta subunit